jgi:hypothetical protein
MKGEAIKLLWFMEGSNKRFLIPDSYQSFLSPHRPRHTLILIPVF